MIMASRVILSNFFEEQWTQTTHNTFQGIRVHFFSLEIAVNYTAQGITPREEYAQIHSY